LDTSREGAYSGYFYGPNTLNISTGVNYTSLKLHLASKTLLSYIAQGNINKSIECFYDNTSYDKALLGDITHTLKLREDISYWAKDNLELQLGTELRYTHIDGDNDFDFQFYVGLSWLLI